MLDRRDVAAEASYRLLSTTAAMRALELPDEVVRERVERLFVNLCVELEPTISVEVGAHGAAFSRRIKRRVPTARCLAFEANPYVHQKYARRVRRRGVDYQHLAVSGTEGVVEIGIPRVIKGRAKPGDNRRASLLDHKDASEVETVQVPSRPLDGVVSIGAADRVVAWIDVEGANEIVLSSGPELLARTSLLFIEVETEAMWSGQWLDHDVHRYLTGLGLVPAFRDVQGKTRRHQYNVAYVSPELAASASLARRIHRLFRPVDAD